jgi:hypothetical protein
VRRAQGLLLSHSVATLPIPPPTNARQLDFKSKVATDITAIFNADERIHAHARLTGFIQAYSET